MKKGTILFDLDGTLVRLEQRIQAIAQPTDLRALSSRYTLGLVTGSAMDEVEQALCATKLRSFFPLELAGLAPIITADQVAAPKNTGLPFLAAKALATKPMVFIGDSDNDVLGATKAEIPYVLVQTYKTLSQQRVAFRQALAEAESLLLTLLSTQL